MRRLAVATGAVAVAFVTHTAVADETDLDASLDADPEASASLAADAGASAEADASDAGAIVDAAATSTHHELPDEPEEPAKATTPDNQRDPSELALLYVASIAWGGSLGLFLDGLGQAGNANAGASLAGVLLTPLMAGVGCVLPSVIDYAYHRRRGVPQTVTTGMLLGLGEGVALNEFFSNHQATSFHTYTKDTAWVFGGTSVGLATGLVVASFVETTPGRAAWVETTGLFGGLFAASIAGAAARPTGYPTPQFDADGRADVGITAAVAGGAGVAIGITTATWFSPSALRVHLIDLGWLTGAVGSGVACNRCNTPDIFLAMAVGSGIGFVGMFLATIPMAPDRPGEHAASAPAFAPFAMPLEHGGFEVGVGGPL